VFLNIHPFQWAVVELGGTRVAEEMLHLDVFVGPPVVVVVVAVVLEQEVQVFMVVVAG
jgi:hypothetical protein